MFCLLNDLLGVDAMLAIALFHPALFWKANSHQDSLFNAHLVLWPLH